MEIPVLVEPILGNGFQAVCGSPLSLSAQGETAEEAVQKLSVLLKARIATGSAVVALEIPTANHAWLRDGGDLQGHPLLTDWERGMAEYRQSVENDPDVL